MESFKCFLRNKHLQPGTVCYPVLQPFHECIKKNYAHFRDTFVNR